MSEPAATTPPVVAASETFPPIGSVLEHDAVGDAGGRRCRRRRRVAVERQDALRRGEIDVTVMPSSAAAVRASKRRRRAVERDRGVVAGGVEDHRVDVGGVGLGDPATVMPVCCRRRW